MKWQTLQAITHSIMVHSWVSDKYINFEFIYKTDHIFTILPINVLANQYVEPTKPQELATGMKP